MKKKKNGMAYAYLAPTLITILLVTCLPILYTVILSFTNYNMTLGRLGIVDARFL